jgi:hypothetical protein
MAAASGATMIVHAQDILVEHSGSQRPCTLWVWLRSQDLDTASEDDLRMLVDATRGSTRFSIMLHRLGPRFEVRQDISAAIYAHADTPPPALPVLTEHLASGALFVWVDGERRLASDKAAALLHDALRWCADDYHDLMAEFQEHLEAAV